jgi:DNA-binding winged helix-turn-helix (wHTH) protein
MDQGLRRGFRIGAFEVEPLMGRIAGPLGSQHLQPKVMDVLVFLAQHAGELVERDTLLEQVWQRVTTEDVLTRCISELRRALGDERGEPRYIQTVPKRGYRLLETVVPSAATAGPIVAAKPARGWLLPVPADASWAVNEHNRPVTNWPIFDEPVSIGRSNDCAVVVRDPSVSRLHATLRWNGNALVLSHESSTNPTLVNGVPIARNELIELSTMDRLQIGGARFELMLWSADDKAETRPHAPPRTLAVVLAADLAARKTHGERDADARERELHECLRVFRRHAQLNRGRVLDASETGDHVYSLYHSVVLALSAAVAIRAEIAALAGETAAARKHKVRYGMHFGDVMIEGSSIRGDALITAEYLQQHGEPGEIIVSPRVYQEAKAQTRFKFETALAGESPAYRLIAGNAAGA